MMHCLANARFPSSRMEYGILNNNEVQPYLHQSSEYFRSTSQTQSGDSCTVERPTSTATLYKNHSFPVPLTVTDCSAFDKPNHQQQTIIHVATVITAKRAPSTPSTFRVTALDCKPGDDVGLVPASVTVPSILVPLPPAITRLVTVLCAPFAPVAVSVVRSTLGVVAARIELGVVVVEVNGDVIVSEVDEELIGIMEVLVTGATVIAIVELFE